MIESWSKPKGADVQRSVPHDQFAFAVVRAPEDFEGLIDRSGLMNLILERRISISITGITPASAGSAGMS